MTKREILDVIAQAHNRVSRMAVSGENILAAADVMRLLQYAAQKLSEDVEAEADGKEDGACGGEEDAAQGA